MPELRRELVANLKGRAYATFAAVLDFAHQNGLKSLVCRIVQIPTPENGMVAIVEAEALFEDGRRFVDIGDASPANTSAPMASAVLRLASTRAKGRVLRDSGNIGEELLDDVSDDDDAPRPAAPSYGGSSAMVCKAPDCGTVLTSGQYAVSWKAFGEPLCPFHQRTAKRIGE